MVKCASNTTTGRQHFPVGWMIMLILLAVTGVFLYQASQHVHPDWQKQEVKNCLNNPNTTHYILLLQDSKFINICNTGRGFGFQVVKQTGGGRGSKTIEEVTSYIKQDVRSLRDLFECFKRNNMPVDKLFIKSADGELIPVQPPVPVQ
jgi:hypothetical protein